MTKLRLLAAAAVLLVTSLAAADGLLADQMACFAVGGLEDHVRGVSCLPIAGGTMTGDLNMAGNCIYVDSDGNSGMCSSGDNEITFVRGTVSQWSIESTGFGSTNSGGARIVNGAPSAGSPNIYPNRSDLDTGYGWYGPDGLELVPGGVSALRVSESGSDTNVAPQGGLTLVTKAADPCADTTNYPAGTLFYTAGGNGFPCYCNDAGDDLFVHDNSACTYP